MMEGEENRIQILNWSCGSKPSWSRTLRFFLRRRSRPLPPFCSFRRRARLAAFARRKRCFVWNTFSLHHRRFAPRARDFARLARASSSSSSPFVAFNIASYAAFSLSNRALSLSARASNGARPASSSARQRAASSELTSPARTGGRRRRSSRAASRAASSEATSSSTSRWRARARPSRRSTSASPPHPTRAPSGPSRCSNRRDPARDTARDLARDVLRQATGPAPNHGGAR